MAKVDYDKGLEIRRAVLGSEYVDGSINNADEFSKPMQDLVTESAWGMVWSRPGLERKTRSLLNLALLTALNRQHELKTHLRGALRNGVTKEEIREVFLHCSAYCGWPATLDGFRTAKEFFAEEAKKG
jgi:4-carboxymuconolactone decarboxylase